VGTWNLVEVDGHQDSRPFRGLLLWSQKSNFYAHFPEPCLTAGALYLEVCVLSFSGNGTHTWAPEKWLGWYWARANSRAQYKMQTQVSIPNLTFPIENLHSIATFCNVVILKEYTVEPIMFFHRNNVISLLGMTKQGLDLEFVIDLYIIIDCIQHWLSLQRI
jgi:hypothetical protein